MTTARHRYDAQFRGWGPRGLPLASLDPLGAQSQIESDQHWPGDDERFADLNVFFVHTPQART